MDNKLKLNTIYGVMAHKYTDTDASSIYPESKITFERTTQELLEEIENAFHEVLKEYEDVALKDLEYILNSGISHNEALVKLQCTYELYNGSFIGSMFMFKRMIGDKVRKVLDNDLSILYDKYAIDIRLSYCKYICRLSEIYKEV